MKLNDSSIAALLLCMGFAVASPTYLYSKSVSEQGVVQQNQKITGNVVDDNGEPVIGATIKVAGTSNGVITDLDGNFSLSAPLGTSLEVSYVGYKTQMVKIGKTSLKILLQEDSKNLGEVVVVGFGTQKKVNLTGSVGIATSKELEARPVTSATQA